MGHTDNEGSDGYNLALSRKRAKSVLDYLVSNRIDPQRLCSEGYGSTRPRAENGVESGRLVNRRVEFLFQSMPCSDKH